MYARFPYTKLGRCHDGGAVGGEILGAVAAQGRQVLAGEGEHRRAVLRLQRQLPALGGLDRVGRAEHLEVRDRAQGGQVLDRLVGRAVLAETRSEEHTSELQSLMRISYAVFCLQKKIKTTK